MEESSCQVQDTPVAVDSDQQAQNESDDVDSLAQIADDALAEPLVLQVVVLYADARWKYMKKRSPL